MDYGAHWDYSVINVWFKQKLDSSELDMDSYNRVDDPWAYFLEKNNFQYFLAGF